jgi:uncharacterized membrane protein
MAFRRVLEATRLPPAAGGGKLRPYERQKSRKAEKRTEKAYRKIVQENRTGKAYSLKP